MQKNLQDYVKVYNNFLDEKMCDSAVENLKSIHFQQHQFYDSSNGTYHSYDKELSISNGNIPEKSAIQERFWYAIRDYLNEFKFKWYNGWNGYSEIRFNRYDVNTQMELHCDHIHSMFDGQRKGVPILSVLGALDDGYKGGEFVMWEDTVIEMPKGSVMVFPSNFMYPHKVNEITEGVRHSVVSWVF
jgi:hypothetical protein